MEAESDTFATANAIAIVDADNEYEYPLTGSPHLWNPSNQALTKDHQIPRKEYHLRQHDILQEDILGEEAFRQQHHQNLYVCCKDIEKFDTTSLWGMRRRAVEMKMMKKSVDMPEIKNMAFVRRLHMPARAERAIAQMRRVGKKVVLVERNRSVESTENEGLRIEGAWAVLGKGKGRMEEDKENFVGDEEETLLDEETESEVEETEVAR